MSSDIVLNPGCSSLCLAHIMSLRRTCSEQKSVHGAHSLVTCAFTMARTGLVLCFIVCTDLAHIRTEGTPKSRCSTKGRAAPAGIAGLHGCECWAVSANDVGSIHEIETGQRAPIVGSREECKGSAASAGRRAKKRKWSSDRKCGTTWMPMLANLRQRRRLYTASCEGQACFDC